MLQQMMGLMMKQVSNSSLFVALQICDLLQDSVVQVQMHAGTSFLQAVFISSLHQGIDSLVGPNKMMRCAGDYELPDLQAAANSLPQTPQGRRGRRPQPRRAEFAGLQPRSPGTDGPSEGHADDVAAVDASVPGAATARPSAEEPPLTYASLGELLLPAAL